MRTRWVFGPKGLLLRVGRALLLCTLLLALGQAVPAHARERRIGLFVGDADVYTCVQALPLLADLSDVSVEVFTETDIGKPKTMAFIRHMDAAVVDIMGKGKWLLENRQALSPGSKIYLVRDGSHPQDFLDAGFVQDPTVRAYFNYTTSENIAHMIRFLADRDFNIKTSCPPPVIPPKNALYHPDAPGLFASLDAYSQWYRLSGHYHPRGLWDLTLLFPNFVVEARKSAVDTLIRAYEANGINTVAVMQSYKDLDKSLAGMIAAEPLAGNLGSITAYIFKFSSVISNNLMTVLKNANVPVINAQHLHFSTKAEWQASAQGASPFELTYLFSTPELSGLVEPTVVGAKELVDSPRPNTRIFRYEAVASHVAKLARRTARWQALRQKPNRDKKVVLIYYNHSAGKQNIGATYLNVFRSISEIIGRLKQEGYTITGDFSEEKVKDLLIAAGRNIGSWAPGELDRLVTQGQASFIDMGDYRKWLAATPQVFQEKVEKDWGKPETSTIMVHKGRFVIPCIQLGNLILAPQPVRGWSDDPQKLYHSTELYPHHQYTAFYLWLQNKVKPDAMISLGTHGTLEWLPGKQAALTPECPPEVLIGDIPHLYPYIVDDVGEGIQAKRRGRAVIIDYSVPPFKRGGLFEEYAQLSALISERETSAAEEIRSARLERIREMVLKLGLQKDLGLETVEEKDLEKIEHYLMDLKSEMVPYGMHTFGKSATDEALTDTATAIAARGEQPEAFYLEQLKACGPSEMESLVGGLSGGYVPSASGNDPIRTPESLPTGKNFYGFDPEKVPSKEAWLSGHKAAGELIEAFRERHDGKTPEQVGLILWSMETIRDEGINVATALSLMGMTPVWDQRDKVKAAVPIPGNQLNRPRIDVLLQMSGLFRDTFPAVALMLDKAVKTAAVQTDLENFIRKHSDKLARDLADEGYSPEQALKLSLVRLFSEPPGAYGNKVADMTGASGLWEKEEVVAEQGFIQKASFGYSSEIWGDKLTPVYRRHLKSVEATVHTRSSNLFGLLDTDDMFGDLGGLSMAVRKESGKTPEVYVSLQRSLGKGHVEPVAATLGLELRSRYLNPKWIEGMKKEDYAGARQMSNFSEYLWGWQVTVPSSVDAAKWQQTYEVYVEDKYGQDLKAFFARANPWAYQSITARMLEAVRKNYWKADEKITRKLAAEYAMNVVEKGVACCDHTCNNPMLNQMVVNIISIPGVLSPEIVEKFTLAVEQAAGHSLDQQVQDRRQLLDALKESPANPETALQPDKVGPETPEPQKTTKGGGNKPTTVEGYRMEKIQPDDAQTRVSTSGVQWFAAVFVLLLIGLFVIGAHTH